MGKHYLLNLYDCSFVLLDDEQFLIKLLESAAILSGATVIQTIFKKLILDTEELTPRYGDTNNQRKRKKDE